MINQDLIKYIDIQLRRGLAWDKIKETLLSNGWTDDVIEENYKEVAKPVEEPAPNKPAEVIEPKEASPVQEAPQEYYRPAEPPQEPVSSVMPREEPKPERMMPLEHMAFEEPKPGNSKRLIIIGAIIGLVVLIGGGAAFAYYQYIFPQKIFYEAISNSIENIDTGAMQTTQSIHADVGVKEGVITLSEASQYKYFSGSLDMQASLDASGDIMKALWAGKLEVSAKTDAQAQDSIAASMDVELRTDNDIIYGTIKDIQGFLNLPIDKNLASEYQQYFTDNILNEWFEMSFPSDGQGLSYYAAFKNSYIAQLQKNTNDYKKLGSYLANAFKMKVIGSEKIEGDDCYHYQIAINQAGLWSLIKEYLDFGENVTDEQWQAYENDYNSQVWPILQKIDIQEWSTKKDPYIRKYSLQYNDNFDSNASMPLSSISLNYSGTFKKLINLIVEIPQNAKSVNELVDAFNNVNSNYVIKASLAQFMAGINDYKTKNGTYSGFISRSFGKDIIEYINSVGGDTAVAYTSRTKYCLAKQLFGGAGSWCIDYKGFSEISENCKKETYSCE